MRIMSRDLRSALIVKFTDINPRGPMYEITGTTFA
jgi:hypothetical protein